MLVGSAAPGSGAFLAAALPLLASLGGVRCYDLYPCRDKPTYAESRCPAGSAVACWSEEPGVPWACWAAALAPWWLAGSAPGMPADVVCRSWQVPWTPEGGREGARPLYYGGACALGMPTPGALPTLPPPPLSWDEAYAKARATLRQMEDSEKHALMRGIGWAWSDESSWWEVGKWWYVGNVPGIPRLNIPSLNMQDSGGGFRPYWSELVDTVTCWPSQLSLASTWEPNLVQVFGIALGKEFAGKGGNVVLGPSVNVHRIARGGRNFEYLSGEDPYLGAKLTTAWVHGVQSQGVAATVKHWVFNEQETNRDSENSEVDEKTAWELYYPPFQAAVDAGVSLVMCSYNRINGKHSCSNREQLAVLKETMGFRGFVQSDWWATHATAVPHLDQDMPGSADYGIGMTANCSPPACINNATWYSPELLASHDVDPSVTRILASIYRLNLTSSCSPPNCKDWFMTNVTSRTHSLLARHIAAESVVLLKNEGELLPLTKARVKSIAIIGPASHARPFDPHGVGQGGGQWYTGDYYSGGGSGHIAAGHVVTALDGIRDRAESLGIRVLKSLTNSTSQAIRVAKQADVTIVVGGAWAGESVDRPSLSLDDNMDSVIGAVASHSENVVVLMQVPGAVLMPWRDYVEGILVMFLGGQETGSAWADVLFGDHAPGGRLPIMMPATELDTIEPGEDPAVAVSYAEGMRTSYRNKAFTPAFPFGHGLTYTTFEYLAPNTTSCGDPDKIACIRAPVRNAGGAAARTVVQLYLELSPEAGHPAPFLKGFEKTGVLLPGATQVVTFGLSNRDLSYYDPGTKNWVRATAATAHIGESSTAIRHSLPLELPGASMSAWFMVLGAILLAVNAAMALVCLRRCARQPASRADDGDGALCGGVCTDGDGDLASDSDEDGGKFSADRGSDSDDDWPAGGSRI